eukprot:GEMP01079962.1.p1 GENE.GEMP01079962.1~~GEMP01079962.1.p1  ORF type:complete len:160 (+),score=20.50 GEMP01079962.1:155-634(+)
MVYQDILFGHLGYPFRSHLRQCGGKFFHISGDFRDWATSTAQPVRRVRPTGRRAEKCAREIHATLLLSPEIMAARRRIAMFGGMSDTFAKSFTKASEAMDLWEKEAELLGRNGVVNAEDSLEVCAIVKHDLLPPAQLFQSASRMAERAGNLLKSLEKML